MEEKKLSPEDIKRVKGLGFLRDKRYPDVFNARVITRNGRITTDEHRAIAEAADRFGSGQVAMTTRLTMEIQGVRYENIQPLTDFLGAYGLTTGGTGALVRPVVSCKGTTCQYGLIDTYALSEKIHQRFYVGYHNMPLPHKFKIAVGGCPNNCVKPDLNDLGVVGQRVPVPDTENAGAARNARLRRTAPSTRPSWKTARFPSTPMPATTAAGVRASAPSARWRNTGRATRFSSAAAGARKPPAVGPCPGCSPRKRRSWR